MISIEKLTVDIEMIKNDAFELNVATIKNDAIVDDEFVIDLTIASDKLNILIISIKRLKTCSIEQFFFSKFERFFSN